MGERLEGVDLGEGVDLLGVAMREVARVGDCLEGVELIADILETCKGEDGRELKHKRFLLFDSCWPPVWRRFPKATEVVMLLRLVAEARGEVRIGGGLGKGRSRRP